jgi:hypothetical protein
MTSEGIGLRNRQVSLCEDVDPPLGVVEDEDSEEGFVQRASVPSQQLDFEDAVLFSELDSMENVLSSGGQLKFTGDPGGPTLTHLRQSWAATVVDLKLKPATVDLTDNDRFHLLVCLTGGGAGEQLGLLQKRLQQEVKARNEPIQREYERSLLTYQEEPAAYEALTDEEKAAEDRPEPPEEPVLSDSFIQPVTRFWTLLENLYPKRSTARVAEFRKFQMKPAESMANMVSRLQTLKLVLQQLKPASVFKFLDAIRPKSLADKVKDMLRMKKMDPNQWTVKDVGDIAIPLEKAQGEESLWTTSKPSASVVVPSGVSGGRSTKNTSVTCYHCGRLRHLKNKCPYTNSTTTKRKAITSARAGFANPKANRSDDKECYTCNKPGHIAKECPQQKGNVTKQVKRKPWCSHHEINTHASESCWALHPELRPSYLKERAAQSAQQASIVPAKTGSSLSANLGSALLSATKEPLSKGNLIMDSYYAEVVTTKCPHSTVEPFAANAGAARTERRSAETQGLRRVTQSNMPLSYLPFPDAPMQEQHPMKEPAPLVITDDLGSFTPWQFRFPRGNSAHTGKDEIDQDLLDATDLSQSF